MRLLSLFLLVQLISCGHTSKRGDYPAHWWKPVSEQQKKWWEIAPDQAGQGEVILSKRNELGILSNFAATPFVLRGKRYASIEGFWQAMKYPEGQGDPRYRGQWKFSRAEVEGMTGHTAKKAGSLGSKNMNQLGIDWVTFEGRRMIYRTAEKGEHYRLIRQAMIAKLEQNPKVQSVLLATKGLILRPDHKQKPNSPPAWKYHQIWMELREQLDRAEKLH